MAHRRDVMFAAAMMLLVVGPASAAPPGDWAVTATNSKGEGCTASHRPEAAPDNKLVNVHLMRSGKGFILLIAARGDWSVSGSRTISLSVDGGAPVKVEADGLGPMILTEIADAALEKQVRKASMLTWILPTGSYTASVAGLGEAADLIVNCPKL